MAEEGLILKGIGGFYTLRTKSGGLIECKARGRFRKDKVTPLCGDHALFTRQREGHAFITEILPRRNALTRPPAANLTELVIVLAATTPKPDLLLADKLLLSAALLGITPLLLINKSDLAEEAAIQAIEADYASCCEVLSVSAKTGKGIAALSARLAREGSVACFAGQSAVGKSSLLNALLPGLDLPTGDLSRKTDRGKHTTRHAELHPFGAGAVLDTPGFSLLELPDPPPEQEALDRAYPEFGDAPAKCRFAGCAHISEPDCAVKALLEEGKLGPGRYARYIEIAEQIREMRKHRYD